MYCQRCRIKLGEGNPGEFIMWQDEEVCVCPQCIQEIRQENINQSTIRIEFKEIKKRGK